MTTTTPSLTGQKAPSPRTLTVAFIGIIADRLMGAWSANLRRRFGAV